MKAVLSLLFILLGLVLGIGGGTVLGGVLTLVFFRGLAFLTHAGLIESGFVAVFWSLWGGIVGGILGGILGLILSLRFLRKKGPMV